MESDNLFAEEQHGFIAGRSCTTQLTDALDIGDDVDVIYVDFAEAFDKVPHQRLLAKLNGYGIQGKIHEWIMDFLSSRQQRVVVNGVLRLVASNEWNSSGQCPRPGALPRLHQRPAG